MEGLACFLKDLRRSTNPYVVTVVATFAAVLLRWLLDPWMGDYLPFVTLYGAIAAAVWFGGYRPAVVAVILGFLACDVLFIIPWHGASFSQPRHYLGFILYLFTCSLIIGFGEAARRAERRTQEGLELLRVTFASMGDAVITTDSEGRMTLLNQVALRLTGWTQVEAAGQLIGNLFRVVDEQTRQAVENPVEVVLAQGCVERLAKPTILIAKDGTERSIDYSAAPLCGANGQVSGCVLVFRDNTERQKVETVRSQLAAIVESSDEAIYSKDLNGIITSWNRGTEFLYGYTAAEVIGKSVSILIPSDRPFELSGIMDRLRKGERIARFQTVRVRKDGRRVDVSLSISPMWDASRQLLAVSIVAQDITARVQAEAEVRRLNAELRERLDEWEAVLNMVPVGIGIAHDSECRSITHNPYISEMLGVPAWENASLSAPEHERHTPYAIYRDGKALRPEQLPMQLACTGVAVQDFEFDLVREGLAPIRLICSARPLRDAAGRIRGGVGVMLDITARKQAELEIRRAEERTRSVVNTVVDGIITIDERGIIESLNPAAEKLFGYPAEEVIGQNVKMLMPVPHHDAYDGYLANYVRAGESKTLGIGKEIEGRRKDGSTFPMDLAVSEFLLGQQRYFTGIVRDITERKEAEATLREQAALLDLAHDAIIVRSFEGEISFWSSGATMTYGFTSAEAIGKFSHDLLRTEFPKPLPEIKADLTRDGQWDGTLVHKKKDGSLIVAASRWALREAVGGKTRIILEINRDITQQKRVEESFYRQAALLRAVNDNTSELIFMKDRACRLTYVNAATLQAIGLTEEQAIGSRDLENFVEPDEYDTVAANDQRVIETGQTLRVEEPYTCADGQQRVFLSTKNPLRDSRGDVIGVISVSLDITDRKRAEHELQQSEARLAQELESITRLHGLSTRLLSADDLCTALGDVLENAMVTCGADFGNIQVYNSAEGVWKIAAQRGFGPEFLDYFLTVSVEGSASSRAIKTGQRIVIEDVTVDSDFTPHRSIAAAAGFRAVQSTPLTNRAGAVIGVLSTHFRTARRLTEREERLLDLYARNAADLIERIRIEEVLKDADRRKDEFLATLAHELRNPLAPLRNGLQLMKRAGQNAHPVIEQARTMMERQVEQLVRLVDDLLDISRITQGKLQVRKESVVLGDVITVAIETASPLIHAANHELTLRVDPRPILVQADPIRLAQLFLNLLNNAAKYTERGGHIWLTVERERGEAVVTVRDNGIGISAEHLPHLFRMFSQVDSALDRSQGGLGIGLSLVKGLVELHGGTIEARSDGHGKGSEFIVRLPVMNVSEETSVPSDGDGHSPHDVGTYRILVVDDLRDSADSMALLLQMLGHEVRTAYDGLDAVQSAETFQPHVILLDIGLPKLNGYEAARRIRDEPWGRNVALVALTGWGQDEDKRRSQEAGFDHHLTKPVDHTTLEELLCVIVPRQS